MMKQFMLYVTMMMVMVFFVSCGSNETPKDEEQKIEEVATVPAGKAEIKIVHAGSLSIPFKEMAEAFMKKFPEYNVLLEAHGSRVCARQVTDLKRELDVMGSADSIVIREMLMPDYADYCIDFTTNEMVIMYTEKSKFSDTITSENWHEILMKPGVQYGHSDPNADPCGYRAVLTWQLAEKHYKIPGFYKKITEKMPAKNMRSKETDLLAMLEAGELDYIFIYRSVAEQHQAKYVVLPEEINLKSPLHAEFYATATLEISGKQPGEMVTVKGEPMIYGLTILKNAPNPEGAVKFVAFILGPEGQEIMKKNGQPELIPPQVDNKEKLPESLKMYFAQ